MHGIIVRLKKTGACPLDKRVYNCLQFLSGYSKEYMIYNHLTSGRVFKLCEVQSVIMKHTLRKTLGLVAFLFMVAFSMSGCAESHYYETNHHHSREWYDRHHTPPPANVNFDVDVHG
jgi:hypothetical protein